MDILSLMVYQYIYWVSVIIYLFIFKYKVFEYETNQVKEFFITSSGPSAGLNKLKQLF